MKKAVLRFIDILFNTKEIAVKLPFFNTKGKLYVVLEICATFMIMYHKQVIKEYKSGHIVPETMLTAGESAKLVDPNYPHASAEYILNKWSEKLFVDYSTRNNEVAEVTPELSSIATSQNQNNQLALNMTGKLDRILRYVEDAEARSKAYELEANKAKQHISVLQEQVRKTKHFCNPSYFFWSNMYSSRWKYKGNSFQVSRT